MEDVLLDTSAVECKVCKNIMYNPISFDTCGHTLCELCMMQIDKTAWETTASQNFPLYRCPECRSGTLLPWQRRPKNIELQNLLSSIPGYEDASIDARKAIEEFRDENPLLIKNTTYPHNIKESGNINLAKISHHAQQIKIDTLLTRIIPILYESAENGIPCVNITTRARDMYTFVKELSSELFKLGIYSVHATPREFTVYITKSINSRSQNRDKYYKLGIDETESL